MHLHEIDFLESLKEAVKILPYLIEKTQSKELKWTTLVEAASEIKYCLGADEGWQIVVGFREGPSQAYINIYRGNAALFIREGQEEDLTAGKVLFLVNLIQEIKKNEKEKNREIKDKIQLIFAKM